MKTKVSSIVLVAAIVLAQLGLHAQTLTTAPRHYFANCDSYYPPNATLHQIDGRTILAFRLLRDGTIDRPSVIVSGGNPDLDQAAVVCATDSKMGPVTQDGVPIEVWWHAAVFWRHVLHSYLTVARPQTCSWIYAQDAFREHREGTNVITFKIATDGRIAHPTIVKSSGSIILDHAALRCADENFRYTPVFQNGHPIEVDGPHVTVNWKFH